MGSILTKIVDFLILTLLKMGWDKMGGMDVWTCQYWSLLKIK